jgi:hypothetical protein
MTAMTTSDKLRENILSTYFSLRLGIILLSAGLPILLYVGGRLSGIDRLADSMSAYYGEGRGAMRDWLVGVMWTIGSFLYLYKGFTDLENLLLNFAGGFLVATAMIPCNCWSAASGRGNRLHGVVAVAFFVSMAMVCLFCANETIPLLPRADQNTFRRRYQAIGVVLLASPAVGLAAGGVLNRHYEFLIEAFGTWTFAYYWWTKSREFRITSAEKRAAQGTLKRIPGRGIVPAAE